MKTTPTKIDRNTKVLERYARGESMSFIAKFYDISTERVSQIIRRAEKRGQFTRTPAA
jgi:Mor family transcriptional regulator